MNLIIIDSCTNSCPYCFAEKEMSKHRANTMSLETFEKVLRKIRATPYPVSVNVLGGEPLLHPQLGKMIEQLEMENNVSNYTVLSGGVVKQNSFDFFSPNSKKINFLFNVNQKKDYRTERSYNLVHDNIGRLIDRGFKVSLGFNIYQMDFDAQEIIEYCTIYGVSALRLAVAKPTYGVENPNLLMPRQYEELSPKVADLIEMASACNVKVNVDCMLPKCFFNDADLSRVIKAQPSVLDGVFGKCGIALDVTPQEDVFRCFATEGMQKKKLDDFENFDEMTDYFTDLFDNSSTLPDIFSKCKDCTHANDQSCKGDCYANWKELDVKESFSSMIENIYNLIEAKDLEKAYSLLKEIKQNVPAVSLLWAYYWLSFGDKVKARSYARNVIILTNDNELIDNAKGILDFVSSS